jgi:hypothetical protein
MKYLPGFRPEVPMADSAPELWIPADLRLAEALQIKADFQSSASVVGQDWQCQKCGEVSEPQFTSCWKCGAIRAAQTPVKWRQREPSAPATDKAAVVEEVESGTPCVAGEKLIAID